MIDKIFGVILVLIGIWGIVNSYKNRKKAYMKLFRMAPNKYEIINKKEYIKAQNLTLFILSAFLINIGLLSFYGYPSILLVVLLPLFNIGFSFYVKKYVKMKK